ncbi:MAG: hypothetical protein IH867_12545, partial [Chloroflexi bacterium]|nr:hypothetical protein [Chloroflexota bacterium]
AVVRGDAESICSIRVSVDSDPDAAERSARQLEQLPGFEVAISLISTEWHAEAVMFTATSTIPPPVSEADSLPELSDAPAEDPDERKAGLFARFAPTTTTFDNFEVHSV